MRNRFYRPSDMPELNDDGEFEWHEDDDDVYSRPATPCRLEYPPVPPGVVEHEPFGFVVVKNVGGKAKRRASR